MQRAALQNPKRCLENDFDDLENRNDEESACKKANLSNPNQNSDASFNRKAPNRFDTLMFEAEVKSNIIKIATLEQELKSEINEKKKIQIEFNTYKDKQLTEYQSLKEAKDQLESALKSCKTNEKLISSEMDRMLKSFDSHESVKAEKDKEIRELKSQIKNLTDENGSNESVLKKEISDLKYEIESKNIRIEQLDNEITQLNESLISKNDLNKKLDDFRKENCLLNNKIKDLELENENLKCNTKQLNDYIDKTNRIEDLERENRTARAEIDFLKANQEKSHLYQEELRSKIKQIERYESKIISLEVDNQTLKNTIQKLSETSKTEKPSETVDKLKAIIKELDCDILKLREKNNHLDDEIKNLKAEKYKKEEAIDQLQKRLTRVNAERNGYKNIIDTYDSEKSNSDSIGKVLHKRIDELELIIAEYKRTLHESNELKLCNNLSFQLQDNDCKSIGIQADLNSDIYSEYEKRIEALNEELLDTRDKLANANKKILQQTSLFSFKSSSLTNSNTDMDFFSNENTNDSDESSMNLKKKESPKDDSGEVIVKNEAYKNLENQYKDLKMLHDQSVSEFEKKVIQMKSSFRHLIGFRVNFKDDKIILTNPKNQEQILIIRINKNFSLSLLDSEFAKSYEHLFSIYLKEHNSMLGLLTAIQFDSRGFEVSITSKKTE